jgi:hypothetical protein
MPAWLLKLLGVSREITEHLDEATFALQRPILFCVGALLLIPIGYFIHRRQRENLATISPTLRRLLTACRVAVLAIMIGVIAGPYVKLDHRLEKRPIVAILIDHSRSMNLPAGPFRPDELMSLVSAIKGGKSDGDNPDLGASLNQMTRWALAHAALERTSSSLVRPLSEKFDLSIAAFDDDLTPLPIDPSHVQLGDAPDPGGKRSAIGSAVEQVIEQAAGRQVAGIVLLTDGQNNGGATLVQAATDAARVRAPVFAVPVGSANPISDVAIADVFTPGLVSVGDTVAVSVTLESQGFDGRLVKVDLSEGDRKLDSKDLTLRGSEQQTIELTFEAKDPGGHYLTVQVTPLDEEPVRENNQNVAFVRVDDQKIPVFYMDGQPRWDFRFLKNAMRRDHGLNPSIVAETELKAGSGNQPSIPTSAEAWATYRTVILGDCSPEAFPGGSLDALAEAVRERGVGLVVLAGPNQMPHAFDSTALLELLPVRPRRGVAGYDAATYNPFKIEITPAGSVHEALRLYEEPSRNAAHWAQMPPYFWCAAAVRPAPGASVLATNPSIEGRFGKLPLIAYHYAGKGRVLFVGTDSTWLWRQNVGDRFFYKFWGQTVRFVARRDEKDGAKSWIEVRPLRAQPGEPVEIELMAYRTDGSASHASHQTVRISGAEDLPDVTLDAESSTPGRYRGRFAPRLEGNHHISLVPNDVQETVEADVHVEYAAEELLRPSINRPALELLANHTGGQLIELADWAKIPERLRGESKFIEIHREETMWDNWFVVVLLASIYCLDVGLRRLTGLS